jgi:peptidoglycan/LPS O-acetylase OafA/YrhL
MIESGREKLTAGRTGTKVYHSLDGLRGIAALAVVFFHYREFLAPISVGSAYLAVDLFFLMSGFVIANAYHDRLGRSLSGGRFVVLRLIRLYPLYLAGTLVALVPAVMGMLLFKTHHWWSWPILARVAFPALLFLPGLSTNPEGELYALNGPAWSLSSELLVNFAYALVAPLRKGWVMPAVVTLCAGVVLIITVIAHGSADCGWRLPLWWLGPIRACFSFFAGVIFFKLQSAGKLPVVQFWLLPIFLIVMAVLYLTPNAQWRALYDLGAIILLFPLVLWLCIVNEPRRGLRFYAFLGLISYPIYTIHLPVMTVISVTIQRLANGRAQAWSPWFGLGVVVMVVAISWLLATTYDPWARQKLARIADRARR